MYDWICSWDAYSQPPAISFEGGLVACDDHDIPTARSHKNTLGHAVERFKSKLAVQIKKELDGMKAKKEADDQHEGGRKENPLSGLGKKKAGGGDTSSAMPGLSKSA
jgi:hypothetical protein